MQLGRKTKSGPALRVEFIFCKDNKKTVKKH